MGSDCISSWSLLIFLLSKHCKSLVKPQLVKPVKQSIMSKGSENNYVIHSKYFKDQTVAPVLRRFVSKSYDRAIRAAQPFRTVYRELLSRDAVRIAFVWGHDSLAITREIPRIWLYASNVKYARCNYVLNLSKVPEDITWFTTGKESTCIVMNCEFSICSNMLKFEYDSLQAFEHLKTCMLAS